MNVSTIKHLLPQSVIEENFIVTFFGEVEASHGEHDLFVVVVEVDYVGRRVAERVLVGHALDDAVGVEAVVGGTEIGLVVGEDEAADAWDRVELVGGGGGPRGAVVAAHVGAALPQPPRAAQHEHTLHHPA